MSKPIIEQIQDTFTGRNRQRPSRLGGTKEDANIPTIEDLSPDVNIFPKDPENLQSELYKKEFQRSLWKVSVFIYGKVWFYNKILQILLGADWHKSKTIYIVHSPKDLDDVISMQLPEKEKKKPIIILPAVHDQNTLNLLVSRTLETGNPVWFIGYPSTLAKHLLASFECFFLCKASKLEMDILTDVAELTDTDVEFLQQKKGVVFISKEKFESLHLTF
jgi:hypothetical protein